MRRIYKSKTKNKKPEELNVWISDKGVHDFLVQPLSLPLLFALVALKNHLKLEAF